MSLLNKGAKWTKKDTQLLLQYKKEGIDEKNIAKRLGRTNRAITCRISKIICDWNEENIPIDEISERINVKKNEIINIISTKKTTTTNENKTSNNKNKIDIEIINKKLDLIQNKLDYIINLINKKN